MKMTYRFVSTWRHTICDSSLFQFFPYICITLIVKFDITKQCSVMQYHGHRGPCIVSLSFAVVTELCRISFPRTFQLILFHRLLSKCWLAVSKDRAVGISRHKTESCLKMLEIFLSIFLFFQRMLIVHITQSFSALTEINFRDTELNICHATVRELFIVSNTTTGPLCCAHSALTVFWLWCHELKDYLRNINICFNGCLHSHIEQTKPHPKKQEFRNKKSTHSCSHLKYRLLLNSQSRQKMQQIVSISSIKLLIRIFLFSAPNSNAYWDIVGFKWTFKTNYQ